MFATVRSSCVLGIDAVPVEVEVSLRSGAPRFSIIGLAGAAVRESRERIVSALEFAGFDPSAQILVNLAPAEIKKESAVFDLPIAVAIAITLGGINPDAVRGTVFCGELSLTGDIKPVPGIIAHTLVARSEGAHRIVVPAQNAHEAAVAGGIRVVPVESLFNVLRILRGEEPEIAATPPTVHSRAQQRSLDDVVGQAAAKRTLELAAAGGHNLLMIGPPGCGKSMLAERLPGLLTPLSSDEQLEVIKIHSIASQDTSSVIQGVRPFRAPHHVMSEAGLIGGGLGPRPGEISLAHRGVLFLDEFPEFKRGVLETLRSPLECGWVQISRARASVRYPARFQLAAAMNPCPCGMYGAGQGRCRCSHHSVREYLGKLSQPILDRIDLHVTLEQIPIGSLLHPVIPPMERDAVIRERILLARERQFARFGVLNSQVSDEAVRKHGQLTEAGGRLLLDAATKLGLSARGYSRVVRVARTIADLADCAVVDEPSIAEALMYRSLDRLLNVTRGGYSLRNSGRMISSGVT